jgi:hypothetical protein
MVDSWLLYLICLCPAMADEGDAGSCGIWDQKVCIRLCPAMADEGDASSCGTWGLKTSVLLSPVMAGEE